MLRRRRLHRLRPERRGGVLPLPNPALDAGKGRSTCGHQPTNGANWPEARTGLVWGMEAAGADRFFFELCASARLALATEKPRAAGPGRLTATINQRKLRDLTVMPSTTRKPA